MALFFVPFHHRDFTGNSASSALLVYENLDQFAHLPNCLQKESKVFASSDLSRGFSFQTYDLRELAPIPLQVSVQTPKILVLRC